MRSMSSASVGVAAVAVAAGLWGTDALLRRPLAHSTEAATIVLGEHVVLVVLLLPIVVAALPALWRAGPRYVAAAVVVGAGSSALATILFTEAFVHGDPVTPVVLQKVQPLIAVSLAAGMLGECPRPRFVAAAVVVGAGSSALATILFTEAFVQGDPVTPVVLQKVQPLIAVSLAAAILGERPRARFGLFLLGGLVGTWLMAFPSPFDVSLHGRTPALYALAAAALWALGTVLGRYLSRKLPFEQVTAVRFAFGLPASLAAVLVLGAPMTASWHDEGFIVLLALVTGLVAVLLYYYGLRRTTASVASVAELTFPVVAIAVGYLAFDATLTSSQLAGVVLTSLVVLGLPSRAPTLVAGRRVTPAVADSAA